MMKHTVSESAWNDYCHICRGGLNSEFLGMRAPQVHFHDLRVGILIESALPNFVKVKLEDRKYGVAPILLKLIRKPSVFGT